MAVKSNSMDLKQTPSPKQILSLTLPSLLLYCIFGMPTIGLQILQKWGLEGTNLDIGQHLWNFSAAFTFLLMVPIFVITKIWHVPLSSAGTHFGNKKLGTILVIIGLVAIPIIYIGSSDPALIAEYPLAKSILDSWGVFILYEICYGGLYYVAYEFFFRGLLQLGLEKHWETWSAIVLVTVITTFIHWIPMHKPFSEIIGAFAVGFLFGYLAHKTDSWYYIFAIHFLIGLTTDIFCGLRYLGRL